MKTAQDDLDVASIVAERLPAAACFHAQQASEKSLKALLVAISADIARTHSADVLLAELEALNVEIPSGVRTLAIALDQYYIPARYPDALGGSSPSAVYQSADATRAIEWATAVRDWVLHRLEQGA